MQNYFNLYVQDVARDFLIEDVTIEQDTIVVVLTGKIYIDTENQYTKDPQLWSQVIIAATPRDN